MPIIGGGSATPIVTVPTVTLFHNAAIPSTDGKLCGVFNFDVKSSFFGTILGDSIDNTFWNWSTGFCLMRRNGVGPSNIVLDNQVIVAQPAVKVDPQGDGTARLVADFGGSGASHDYFTSADNDRFPVYDMPAADTTTLPQLRAGSAGSANFTANFGSNFVAPLASGSTTQLKIFSQRGKVIYVRQGSSASVLHIDTSHNLCQASGADITMTSATLLNSIPAIGQARFQIYINENNSSDQRLEHDFSFIPHDINIGFDDVNFSVFVKYNANAATDGVTAYWSSSNSRIEADMVGNANITLKASISSRPDQVILGI